MSRKKIVVTIVAILIALTGITAISVGAQPGSPLYPFKSIVEAIQGLIVRVLNLEETTAELGECFEIQETCDGIDQPDCFGMTEDDLMQTCGSDEGECHKGIQLCEDGSWGPCIGEIGPTAEVCDGKDNDCDGTVDEECEGTTTTTTLPEVCIDGQPCNDGDACTTNDVCTDGTCGGQPVNCDDGNVCTVDSCDSSTGCVHENAVGMACDDGDPCTINDVCTAGACVGEDDPLIGTACDGADSDLCPEGTYSCTDGMIVCSDNTGSTVDLCDGVDNDCDPASADGSEDPLVGTACDGADTDLCEEGTYSCSVGSMVCSDSTGNDIEVCDGMDNDCDGAVDEGFANLGDPCSVGVGQCYAEGVYVCSGDQLGTECNAIAGTPSPEICDNIDNDCDGSVDEGLTCWTCFGISKDDPSVCSGHGECTSQDTCVCDVGWTGADCSTPVA